MAITFFEPIRCTAKYAEAAKSFLEMRSGSSRGSYQAASARWGKVRGNYKTAWCLQISNGKPKLHP
jgi:hypothetical protein